MNFYALALFAHILGVLGLFIGIGFERAITLRQVQTIAQVR